MPREARKRWHAAFASAVRLYPRAFRTRHSRAMEDAFLDSYDAHVSEGRSVSRMLLHTGMDLLSSIVRERSAAAVASVRGSPLAFALLGLMHVAPLLLLNAVVGARIEPLFSLIRPGSRTSPQELVVLSLALVLILVGALVAVTPLRRGGRRQGPRELGAAAVVLGGTSAALLVALFVALAAAFGSEIVRCDILDVPNCD
ncbi:hypothetical protein [Microbacterium sp.]|uniref:hypothetical protein n=1 Tax=Microbacterium sp. TaxID=51671 RepID=UPI003C72547B